MAFLDLGASFILVFAHLKLQENIACSTCWEGEGVTSLYKPNRYVLPQRVWFLRCFGLKTGIDFPHFGQELGMVFKGTTFQFKMMNKEQKICESK